MRRPLLTALAVALTAGPLTAGRLAAQAPPPRRLTLGDALGLALRGNPDVLTARLRVDSAGGERRIARALPDPVVSVVTNTPTQYTVTEPIDVTPARLYRTRAARLGQDAARDDERDQERQTVYAVRQAFADALLAERLRDVAAAQRELVRQVLVTDSARLKAGDVPDRNVARSELEFARADAALDRAVAGVHAARLALQQLVGVAHPDTALGAAGDLRYAPVAVDTAGLRARALAARPDLAGAATRVAQGHATVSNARALLVPLPQLTYAKQYTGPFDNGHSYMYGVGFQLPFPYLFGGERQRARAALAAAEVAEQRARLAAEADVAGALEQYRVSTGLAARYVGGPSAGGLLAKADRTLDAARYAYRAGAASQLDLIDALRTDADTRTDYYTALHDYWVSVFALARAAGADPAPDLDARATGGATGNAPAAAPNATTPH